MRKFSAELRAFRKQYLLEGEEGFLAMMEAHPHKILVPMPPFKAESDIAFMKKIDLAEEWIRKYVKGKYVAFPTEAIGKYKDMWQYVFFKDPADAVMFKLVWG